MLCWRPPRRLRHVAGVTGRGLQIPSDSAAFFSICIHIPQPNGKGIDWKLVYCSEPREGTHHPEWSPLPPSLVPSHSPVEIFIAIHTISFSTIMQQHTSTSNELDDGVIKEKEEGSERGYKNDVMEALRSRRAFIPSDEEKERNKVVAAVHNGDTRTITAAGNGGDQYKEEERILNLEKVDDDGGEKLQKALLDYLEESLPGKVCAAYHIKLNDLFSLGQHLAGDEETRGGPSFLLSRSTTTTQLAAATAANTKFLPNTLIFDFFDGQYGSFPWPSENLQLELEQQRAVSAAPSIPASKEPSPFPSPTKLISTTAAAGREKGSIGALPQEDLDLSSELLEKDEATDSTYEATTATATTAASLGLGSMLMSKLRGSGAPLNGESTSGTATPTNNGNNTNGMSSTYNNLVIGFGGAKMLPVDQFRDQIENISTLQSRIQFLSTRCEESQARIDRITQQQAFARQQHAELQSYEEIKIELTRKLSVISQQVVEATKQASAAEKSATVTSQALISTLQALQSAHRRISAGESSLKGEEGRGRLAMALRELIARRCLMTVQLGWILRLGPVAIYRRPPHVGGLLDAQLETQWAGGGGSSSGIIAAAAPSSSASSPQKESREGLQEDIRLAICGLGLDSSVWRHAFDPGGYDWDPAQDKAASVALGYSALLIEKLAQYLGIVLRYPVIYRGSVSVVMDNHPQAGTWRPEVLGIGSGGGSGMSAAAGAASMAAASFLFGRAQVASSNSGGGGSLGDSSSYSSSSPAVAVTPVEYPLYCLSNKDRPRFAVGVFLLNKNAIQLLQAHGISAAGPSQLLQNLHKLVAAAQSGIPQGLGSGYWKF